MELKVVYCELPQEALLIEMAKILDIFTKYVVVFVISLNVCQANLDSFNFEQIKNNLFFKSHLNNWHKASVLNESNSTKDTIKCAIELNQIKNGLKNKELWAMKSNLNK